MTGTIQHDMVDVLGALSGMRATIYRAWEKFLAAADINDLLPHDMWLLLQLTTGPLSSLDIETSLAFFVEEPAQLLARGLERGWIRPTDDGTSRYELTEGAKVRLYQIFPVAQSSNEGWRDALIHNNEERRQLAMVLGMLQGVRSSMA